MRVFVCSRLRADTPEGVEANLKRARSYCLYVVEEGHRPYAPHLFFPQFLDDSDEEQRAAGIAMGVAELLACDQVWVFGEAGQISAGMRQEIDAAEAAGIYVRHILL